jgi:hypothetical protein
MVKLKIIIVIVIINKFKKYYYYYWRKPIIVFKRLKNIRIWTNKWNIIIYIINIIIRSSIAVRLNTFES